MYVVVAPLSYEHAHTLALTWKSHTSIALLPQLKQTSRVCGASPAAGNSPPSIQPVQPPEPHAGAPPTAHVAICVPDPPPKRYHAAELEKGEQPARSHEQSDVVSSTCRLSSTSVAASAVCGHAASQNGVGDGGVGGASGGEGARDAPASLAQMPCSAVGAAQPSMPGRQPTYAVQSLAGVGS